ncbi:tetratricopeptide repeat protein [Gracilimonas mengyeensis]|uniref:Tetratricopeptide repeat-containing protein n=1 Tax=Gracilimonas mengyeensis TaxID=1302730 RepID=A0A521DEY8_9BACT|nr:tetratricopeptide repeat protein [Gracilimonas mengyeensis]SMO70142.1 Tetratricopeptide repeat-containing protein [Gracilimonas mengyeensis]
MDKSKENNIRQQIDAYIKGKLGEEEIQELWTVFAKNPELLDLLELEVNVKAIIEEQAKQQKQSKSTLRKLPSWSWYAAAAVVILTITVVQFFQVDTPTSLNQLVVQDITAAQLETADGIRAMKKDDRITTADSLLNLGFEAVISGNENRALEIFNEVIQNHDEEPYGSKAYLNKGIVLYNEGNYPNAISAFNEAIARAEHSRMIQEKGFWYLGNALINTGQLEDARDAVYKAYQLDGVFRKPAFRILKKLNDDLGESDYEEFDTQSLN